MNHVLKIVQLVIAVWFLQVILTSQTVTAQSMGVRIPYGLLQLGNGEYFSKYAFVVDKKNRVLSIWSNENGEFRSVAHFPADMGRRNGDKHQLGDHRTPEGIYFFLEHYPAQVLDFSRYGKGAFALDYPNFFDALEGKTGSGIWLHAVPDDISLTRGSRGCVVVRNEVIEKVGRWINLSKTPILIVESLSYENLPDKLTHREDIIDLLRSWRDAWQNSASDIDSYMAHYSENFSSQKMNKIQWQKYKIDLAKNYDYIQVNLSRPVIYRHKNEMVIRMLQDYQSDAFSDYGEKILYLHQEKGDWKIVGEEWTGVKKRYALPSLDDPTNTKVAKRAPASKE